MPLYPLEYRPGVNKTDSTYTGRGRFTDMDHCRFVAGYPEKIGGVTNVFSTAADDAYRGLIASKDNSSNYWLVGGTFEHLYRFNESGTLISITPFRIITSSTLANPFDTTINDATVNVNHTAHGLSTNDYVLLVGGAAVGGLTIAGYYTITVTGVDDYTIEASSNATSSVTGGGGTTNYSYYRTTLGADPFATTSGSANVVVTHTAHGALTGDQVTISGAAAVAGITLSGEYSLTKLTDDTYRVTHTSNANATTTGGGAAVQVRYNVSFVAASYGTSLRWALYEYGQQILASPSALQATRPALTSTIYVWDPTINSGANPAYPLYNAPTSCNWMFVTPERFVFALGTTTPMTVQWPDQDDYTNWTPAAGNTANSRTLQEGKELVGGIPVRDGVSLVLSNSATYQFNYRGDEFVYESTLAAKNAGLIGPLAINALNGVAYWMDENDFWMWNGAVQRLPSDDIHSYIFDDLSDTIAWRQDAVCGVNPRDNEIWFFYNSKTAASDYNSRYAIYHIDQGCFSIGTAKVTSYIYDDSYTFGSRILVSASDGKIYQMEVLTTTIIDTAVADDTATVTYAPTEISNGDVSMDILGFVPDFKRQTGNITLTVTTQEYPRTALSTAGTFTLGTNTTRLDLRESGRLVGCTIAAAAEGDFRLGIHRVEAQPAGGRR